MTQPAAPATQPGAARHVKPWLAWALAGLSFALVALWLAMVIAYHREVGAANTVFDGSSAVIAVVYPAVGLLIAVRRSGNRIGWLMITIGLSFALSCVSHAYTERGPLTGPHAPVAGQWVDWLGTWVWVPGWVFLFTLLLLLFPDGHPPSPRWRPAIWLTLAAVGAEILGTWLDPNPNSEPTYHNPDLVATQATRSLAGVFEVAGLALGVAAGVVCLAALIMRFRRSRGEQRQQMKWFAYAGVATLVLLPGNTVLATTPVLQVMGYVDVILLPVAIGIAILKYRLYDIDVVISKTVVYAVLAAFITAVYVLLVVVIGSLAGLGGRPNLALSILATALVAVAFQPVRARAQRLANRLVYGQRATPYQALAQLSERMAGTYATESLLPTMATIVAGATGASRADVWLRDGGELHAVASWPAGAGPRPAIALAGGAWPPAAAGADQLVEVRHDGELLGALSVTKKRGDAITPTEDRLIGNLATQAGLVLRNAGLTEQLMARLADLRASRERLVTAQDRERRRLERDLRDGAQRELAGLAGKLGQAADALDRDEAQAKALLTDVTAEIARALAGLRELARGIYPPLLADMGVAAALDAQARKAPIDVSVEADGIGRYPQEIEAAVYFCALEALRSAAGQADAARASVRLFARDGQLRFEVAGDGGPPGTGSGGPGANGGPPGGHGRAPRTDRGWDAGGGGPGADLQAMADRIDALGGEIRIDPAPGRGTRISGSVPATAIGLPAHPCCGPAGSPMASLVASPSRRIALR
jgi:signal transduction histidine kinase